MAGWRAADAVERVVGSIPAASGAVVMGTGIVSIALALVGRETLSRILARRGRRGVDRARRGADRARDGRP
jgi:hypothetical protein